jgi:putative ubiquitin-RnfH superfamily antitoxin RatB of RatAB toxin-antitoxin module
MDPPDRIPVVVAYALPEQQSVIQVEVEAGSTALDAVQLSGILDRFPEIASRPLDLAVFGRKVQATTPVRPGDRIEILRPLIRDPKETRRQLAGRGQTMGRKAPA